MIRSVDLSLYSCDLVFFLSDMLGKRLIGTDKRPRKQKLYLVGQISPDLPALLSPSLPVFLHSHCSSPSSLPSPFSTFLVASSLCYRAVSLAQDPPGVSINILLFGGPVTFGLSPVMRVGSLSSWVEVKLCFMKILGFESSNLQCQSYCTCYVFGSDTAVGA